MEKKTLEHPLDHMRQYIRRQVAAGFASEEELLDSAVEIYADEHAPSVLRPYAKTFLEEAIAAHLQEQAAWEAITDYDRLTQAFEELEDHGIVSRQNFSCCGTCGSTEILDEMEEAKNKGKKVRGYAFFHMQDTEHAVEGQGLYLNYGSVHRNRLSQILIGHQISRIIRQHGLTTEWNGDLQTRIFVQMDWKRRR